MSYINGPVRVTFKPNFIELLNKDNSLQEFLALVERSIRKELGNVQIVFMEASKK